MHISFFPVCSVRAFAASHIDLLVALLHTNMTCLVIIVCYGGALRAKEIYSLHFYLQDFIDNLSDYLENSCNRLDVFITTIAFSTCL